jgi:hypothetical protein
VADNPNEQAEKFNLHCLLLIISFRGPCKVKFETQKGWTNGKRPGQDTNASFPIRTDRKLLFIYTHAHNVLVDLNMYSVSMHVLLGLGRPDECPPARTGDVARSPPHMADRREISNAGPTMSSCLISSFATTHFSLVSLPYLLPAATDRPASLSVCQPSTHPSAAGPSPAATAAMNARPACAAGPCCSLPSRRGSPRPSRGGWKAAARDPVRELRRRLLGN